MKHIFLGGYFILTQLLLFAQGSNTKELFTPKYDIPAANVYRSAKGTPGAQYWQNRADYVIHATLNDKDSSVSGDVSITYTNNSPDKLEYLWLQLDQNLFDPNSRGSLATPVSGDRFDVKGYTKGGFHTGNVTMSYGGKTYTAETLTSDARMQVRLQTPMKAKGDKIIIRMKYSFSVPPHGADRLGRFTSSQGSTYEIAQWYPRMCVYDDVEGWNTLPYMGLGEFYCEYGNYDYYITAPARMLVYGSGDLQNEKEVLTAEQIRRLGAAKKSDKTVFIITQEEVGRTSIRPTTQGTLTWHFKMNNTRDVAWVASDAMLWDAARVSLPSGRKAIAMSAYPKESIGDSGYTRSTEYLKHSMEIYSKLYYEYPWNSAVDIAGIVTGMEYPGIIFDDYTERRPGKLWDLITHEIGHNWFPMIVGSNERKYMWQDEGFNTFINRQALKLFNKGEFAKDTAVLNEFNRKSDSMFTHKSSLMTPSESMPLSEYGDYYRKTAIGLEMLRNVVLDTSRFDYAFKHYIEAWAFKHPTPYDFFRCMNNAAGEDLGWFWNTWFFTTGSLDQAVTDVKRVNDSTFITVENRGELIMPVIAKVYQSNGSSETIKLPVEVWQREGTWTFKYVSARPVERIVLDPDNLLRDVDRRNNEWVLKK